MKDQATERHYVLWAHIEPDPEQPRKHFDKDKLQELADSFGEKAEGIHTDLLVREHPTKAGRFILVAGERRWRAADLAEIERVPVRVVSEAEAKNALQLQLTENMQRENMTALEEAAGAQKLLEECRTTDAKFSVEQLGAKLGLKRAATYELLALNKVSKPVREALTAGKIDASKARLFATVPEAQHVKLLKEAGGDQWEPPMSVRELADHIAEEYTRQLNAGGWKLDDATLVKAAGPCSTCLKRSGNIEGMTGNANICTDTKCYEAKVGQHALRQLQAAKATGARVIPGEEYAKKSYNFAVSSEKPWQDKKGRTWNQLGAAANIAPAVTINSQGEAVKVFTPDDKAKIFKANKLSAGYSAGPHKPTAAELKRKAEQKAKEAKMNAARTTMCLAAATESDKPNLAFFRKLALTVALGADYGGFDERCFTGRGMNPEDKRGEAVVLAEYINKQVSVDNLASLIVDLLTCELSDYSEDGGMRARAMLIWGVDWKKDKGVGPLASKTPATKPTTKVKGGKKK